MVHYNDLRILWDAIKGFISSNAIMFCSNTQKARSLQFNNLEAKFKRLDSALPLKFTERVTWSENKLINLRNNILNQKSKFQSHRTRQRYYIHGARPSHLLDIFKTFYYILSGP